MQTLLRALAAAYSERHPHVAFEFTSVGSTAGIEHVHRGEADVALVSRELVPGEEYDSHTGKRRLAYTVVARDGIAVIVNENSLLREFTLYQVRDLFGGQITAWKELGGTEEEIVVVSREDGSGTRAVFEEIVMRGRRVTPTAVVMPSSAAVRDYVATHEGATGYLSVGCLGPGVAPANVDEVQPERQTVERDTYPVTRPFLLVSLPEPEPEIASFMRFSRSLPGQAVVRRTHGGVRSGALR
jgi:phosphate transport system substrate-binding protein